MKKARFPIYGNALFVCCKYFLFTDGGYEEKSVNKILL